MNKLKIGNWYYRMMGYAGNGSEWCCILRATGKKTAPNMFSMFGGNGKGMHELPVTEEYVALDERGREYIVSANDLSTNGHIGIGTLRPDEYNNHKCSIWREDARLLVEEGIYSEEEIAAEFPFAFKTYDEECEEDNRPSAPMTEKQIEILKAVKVANDAKEKREKEEKARKFAEAIEKARKRFSYIPFPKPKDGYLKNGEKSRNLRAVLAHEFPGVKFSVSTNTYSGGSSATVSYENGPSYSKVERLVDEFQTSRNEPMTDYWDYVPTATTQVCGGWSYTHVNRKVTDEKIKQYAEEYFAKKVGADKRYIESESYQLLKRTDIPNGAYVIEGIVYNDDIHAYEIIFKKPAPPTSPKGDGYQIKQDGSVVSVSLNSEKKGIEIRFVSIPSAEIREMLKGSGFRWSKVGKLWYNKDTEDNRKCAEFIAEEFNKEKEQGAA